MKKRIITAIIGISITLLIIFFSYQIPFLLNLVIAAIGAFCTLELCTSMKLHKNYVFFIPCLVFTAALPIIAYASIWSLCWFIYTLIIFAGIIFYYDKIAFKDIITAYSMTLLISVALGCIVMLRDCGKEYGVFYFVLPLVLAWCADAGAYFIGSAFGKKKLCPHVSPKKTVAGAIGGIIFGVVGSLVCCVIFQYLVFPTYAHFNYFWIIVASVIGAVLSEMGDLSFSIVKRSCHVKDFGDVMPGHGGFLDRFDSVMFVAPFLFIFVQYIPLVV